MNHHPPSCINIQPKLKLYIFFALKIIDDRRMSQNTKFSNFADVWKVILEGIELIYQLQPLTPTSYMELQT
jgi:hypothetical protein